MSRRRRRNPKSKETQPQQKTKGLTKKLKSIKKIQNRKKKVVKPAVGKTSPISKKVKNVEEEPIKETKPKDVIQVPDKVPEIEERHDEPAVAAEEIVNDKSVVLLEEDGSCDSDDEGAMHIVISDAEEVETPSEEIDKKQAEDATQSELKNQTKVDENHNEADTVDSSSQEEDDIMGDSNSPYVCTICNITTDSSSALTNHMRQHSITNNQTHQCLICSKSLSSASSLDRHMLVHSGERPFRCKLCDMSFTTNGNMHRHMRTHGEVDGIENGKTVDLRKWDGQRSSDGSDKEPENLMKIEAKIHCPVCGKGYLCKNGLKTHMETHPNDPILCQKCDVLSVNYNAHVDHKCEALSTKSPVKCQNGLKCGFQDLTFMDFTSSKFSLVSKSYCEQNVKRPSSAFHAFECKECKKAFPCGRALKLHLQVHETDVGTYCPSCQCDFAASSFLQLHQLKHRSVEHCLNNAFHSSELNPDLKLTQNPSPLAGKEDFLALLNLQTKQSQLSLYDSLKASRVQEDNFENMDYFVHAKVKKNSEEANGLPNHNNNNDFADIQSIISVTSKTPLITAAQTSPIAVCPASPSPFPSSHHPKSPTIAESASASPETPSKDEMIATDQDVPEDEYSTDANGIYSCKICSQSFKNSNHLKRHSKLHVQRGSNYSCHLCSYVSVDKSTLIRHLRTHNGERPFQCIICKFAFTTKANCERHVKKRHKKFGKVEIRNSMQYNPNMSHRNIADATSSDVGNSETKCKYCGNDFKFNRVLRHHLRSLHNSCNRKPFSCKICKFGFSTKNNCIRHVLKQHPNLKDKLRSVVIPNSQMQQNVTSEFNSSTDNSNSSTTNQLPTCQAQPLDLHCNASEEPLDLQSDKTVPESSTANATVMAAEGLVSLSKSNPLQVEPLDLAPQALDLSCKSLAIVTKKSEPKPTSIHKAASPPCVYKPVGFIDLSIAKSTPAPVPEQVKRIQISPLPMNNCSKKLEVVSRSEVNSNTPGQKQRAFTCIYCCAGFTLKSNMERHIKRKHPEFARPTRSRNFIPSMVAPNLQKPNSNTLSDKTRDALRHVLSTKVQQVPVYKSFNPETLPKIGSTFKIVGSAHSFIAPVTQIPGHKAIMNLSLDLSGKTEKVAIIDINNANILKPAENGNDEPCSDLASVSSVICTANSPQFKQYLGKPSDIEKMEVAEPEEKTEMPEEGEAAKGDTPAVSCPFCDKKFPWTSSLRRHILTHTGQKPYKCPKCSLFFTTKSNCERHLIRKHGHKGDLITRTVPDRPYKCNHCLTSTFSTQGNLRKHFYLKHWTKSYLGMNCKPIQMDRKSEEPKEPDVPKEGDPKPPTPAKMEIIASVATQEHSYSQPKRKLDYACSFCDSSFESIAGLRGHMPKHNSVVYMCYLCRKTFSTNEDCYSHFKTSHSLVYLQLAPVESVKTCAPEDDNEEEIPEGADKSKSPVACMVCFRKMSSVEKLQLHFKKHLKEKPCDTSDPKESITSTPEVGPSSQEKVPAKKPRLKGKVKNSLLYLFTPTATPVRSPKTVGSSNASIEEDSDLIQNLLGIHDSKTLDEIMVSADSAARILGVKEM